MSSSAARSSHLGATMLTTPATITQARQTNHGCVAVARPRYLNMVRVSPAALGSRFSDDVIFGGARTRPVGKMQGRLERRRMSRLQQEGKGAVGKAYPSRARSAAE